MHDLRIGVRCKNPQAGELGCGNVAGFPFNRRASLARLFDSQQWLGFLFAMLGAQFGVIGSDLLHKRGLQFRVDQAPDHADCARGIENVNDRLRKAGRNLDCRMCFAGGCAANEQWQGETLAFHFFRDVDHFVQRWRNKPAQADYVGLSGLITPSLDEMVHVAKEMERQGFTLPLLIGGATTSKAHTAVKIAPSFSQPVIHVLDASRAVGVVGSLINPLLKPAFVEKVRADYTKLRSQHGEQKAKPLLTIEQARQRRTPIEWKTSDIATPEFTGLRILASDADSQIMHHASRWPIWSPSSTGLHSSIPGNCAGATPPSWRILRPGSSSRTRRHCSVRSFRSGCLRRGRSMVSSQPMPSAMMLNFTRMNRARPC